MNGYGEVGSWTPSGATGAIEFDYMASTFKDTPTAQAAFTDAQTTLKSHNGATNTDCTTQGIACYFILLGATLTNGTTVVVVGDVLQYNQCLAETAAEGPAKSMSDNSTQVLNTLTAITAAAAATLKSACGAPGPLQFSIVKVQFEKPTTTPQLTDKAIKKAKRGTRVTLVGVFSVTSGPAKITAVVSYVLKSAGKTLKKGSKSAIISPDPTGGAIAVPFTLKLPNKKGTTKATMTFTLGDQPNQQTQKGTASIKIT